MVRHDFLRQLLDPTVFDQLTNTVATGLQPVELRDAAAVTGLPVGSRSPQPLPLEYVVAVGRFGHSMVRNNYFINDTHFEVNLKDNISRMTGGRGGASPRLPADWVVAWERFFYVGPALFQARSSQSINTRIAPGLFEPEPPGMPPLPVRTLLRGYRTGLPSGQEIARAMGIESLTPDQIASGSDADILIPAGFDRQTPLWYYILKEAELTGNGAHLGILGSWLTAKVMMDALTDDPESYLSIQPDWVPTLTGPQNPALFGMADLLRFAIAPSNR